MARLRGIKEYMISKVAEKMVVTIDTAPTIAQLNKPVSEAKVAFITTAGIHMKNEPGFDTKNGDHTYRIVAGDADIAELAISHEHYDTAAAKADKNVVFPLEVLREFAAEGLIGSVAPRNFGLMGYIPKVQLLIKYSAPEIADMLIEDKVDIALLSPG